MQKITVYFHMYLCVVSVCVGCWYCVLFVASSSSDVPTTSIAQRHPFSRPANESNYMRKTWTHFNGFGYNTEIANILFWRIPICVCARAFFRANIAVIRGPRQNSEFVEHSAFHSWFECSFSVRCVCLCVEMNGRRLNFSSRWTSSLRFVDVLWVICVSPNRSITTDVMYRTLPYIDRWHLMRRE